ncbi:hypothetical protein CCACVL1_24855 [Corchorus capsularis]|uniref:Uncharacterized protein n=1 Tax=Corchorus capsularis TaxID=210143 RepID=A0A1R3GMQ4_COCAP|nr:hypothetical protein CCACVL1_24855 [Corchorus capsularis]
MAATNPTTATNGVFLDYPME